VSQVVVRIDHEDNLHAVQDEIKALGLETFSLAEVVDQIRLNILLISIACTFVADWLWPSRRWESRTRC